ACYQPVGRCKLGRVAFIAPCRRLRIDRDQLSLHKSVSQTFANGDALIRYMTDTFSVCPVAVWNKRNLFEVTAAAASCIAYQAAVFTRSGRCRFDAKCVRLRTVEPKRYRNVYRMTEVKFSVAVVDPNCSH